MRTIELPQTALRLYAVMKIRLLSRVMTGQSPQATLRLPAVMKIRLFKPAALLFKKGEQRLGKWYRRF
jgi:hypothetical protein